MRGLVVRIEGARAVVKVEDGQELMTTSLYGSFAFDI
jgi:hypothetical protein